jgi:AraC-like DNA-binding protein
MRDHISVSRALDYIEDNLCEPISPGHIAWLIGYTRTYFDQCFSAAIGESLASYLRKRRLSEAARQLITSKKTILEIALDYQYQSAEAFTRAFYKEFRFTPSAYRKRKHLVRFFSRIWLSQQPALVTGFHLKLLRRSPAKSIQPFLLVQNSQKLWVPPRYNRLLLPSRSLLYIK